MRIEDDKLLQRFRDAPRCELCGKVRKCDPHHAVYTRGHCRLDIAMNLVSLCRECHGIIDTRVGHGTCIVIIAARENCSTDDVRAVCRFFRNLPKGLDSLEIKQHGLNDDSVSALAYKFVLLASDAMPDQSPVASPIRKRKRRPSPMRERAKAARAAAYQRAKARKKAKA